MHKFPNNNNDLISLNQKKESKFLKHIWLSGLRQPQAFLTALIQLACRKNNWPLDQTYIHTEISQYMTKDQIFKLSDKVDEGECTVYVSGIYIEGAQWDAHSKMLVESHGQQTISSLPLLEVKPVCRSHRNGFNLKDLKKFSNDEYLKDDLSELKIPVYTTTQRNNSNGKGYVFEASLKCSQHPNFWILKGTALILNKE